MTEVKIKNYLHQFGYEIDALPINPKGKDKFIENMIRMFGVVFAGYFLWHPVAGIFSYIFFFVCFFIAGIHDFKFYQNGKMVEFRMW